MIMAINEETRRQAIGTGHHNLAETIKPQTCCPSLRQPVFDWNARDK